MNVTIVEGNLLDQDVDVIVNAWNRNIIPWWLLLPWAAGRRQGHPDGGLAPKEGPVGRTTPGDPIRTNPGA